VRRDLHEANRRSWNAATLAHQSHKRDQAGFLRSGGTTLFPEERELLGEVAGKAVAHLQCNAGQDTLSIAALGARVIGVDISDDAIRLARELSRDSGIAAVFERADVYDWLEIESPESSFDVAFCSYGALCWLSDVERWARGVGRVLAPGGRLALVEFHPVLDALDDAGIPRHSYFGRGEPRTWVEGVADYVARSGAALAPSGFENGTRDFVNPSPCHEFTWPVADVVQAVLNAGLTLETLREWPYANGCRVLTALVERPGRRFVMPEGGPELPLMFGLAARK
jgi:SAM-dependent methyltransferase